MKLKVLKTCVVAFAFCHALPVRASSLQSQVPTTTEFLETIHPIYPRPDSWPDRLTFETVENITLPRLSNYISRTKFRVNHACSGRAIEFEKAITFFRNPITGDFSRLFAGVLSSHPYYGYEFRSDQTGERFFIGTVHDLRNNREHSERSTERRSREPYRYTWELAAMDSAKFSLTLRSSGSITKNEIIIEILRVLENNEIVLRVIEDTDSNAERAVCEEGETYQNVMTPIDSVTS